MLLYYIVFSASWKTNAYPPMNLGIDATWLNGENLFMGVDAVAVICIIRMPF